LGTDKDDDFLLGLVYLKAFRKERKKNHRIVENTDNDTDVDAVNKDEESSAKETTADSDSDLLNSTVEADIL
jgi:hypothetical protein